jgi:hypothetical protein
MAALARKSGLRTKRKIAEFISRTEALFIMVVAAIVGAVTLAVTGSEIRALLSGPVTLELPLGGFSPPSIGGLPEQVRGARYGSVEVAFASVPAYEARLLALASALSAVLVLAVCLLVWVLCRQVRAERPFSKASARAIGLVGITVSAAGTFAQAVDAAGRGRLVESSGLFPERGGSLSFLMEFDPAPLVIGLVMALFAAVVHRGRRLQDDVVGLV